MISKETIDKVYESLRLEEVIGDFVQLKRSGSNYKGLSPFSSEKTPSFMVSPAKQIWKDFSSGKGGNAISFLMEHEHFSFVEAIKYLAKKYHIEVEETTLTDKDKEAQNEKESMYLVSEYAQKYFNDVLLHSEEGKAVGLTYFKERGFLPETIQKFQLGYCLDQWSAFTDEALKNQYQLTYLEKTGLTIVKEDKRFDRFKGRVLFPIHSMSGRILGFGGRTLSNDKKVAKYLNSPESEIYHKSHILYGIFQAKQEIIKKDFCYLVEGYTDVIQLYQRGIQNVVASSGTALTIEQIRLIHRLTPNVTILYDGDAAGIRASLRGIDLVLEQGMNVKICPFPEGEDPDSFARKNAYEDIVLYFEENTQDFIRYKASLLISDAKNDPLKRAEIIRDMVGSIAKIPDAIKQEIYIRECASIMNISEEVLFSTLGQILNKDMPALQKKVKQEQKQLANINNGVVSKNNFLEVLEREIISNLILHGGKKGIFKDLRLFVDDEGNETLKEMEQELYVFEKFFMELHADEIAFSSELFQNIFDFLIREYQQDPSFEVEKYSNELPQEIAIELASVFAEYEKYQLHKWEEKKKIITKDKDNIEEIVYAVSSVLINIRKYLIGEKIKLLQEGLLTENEEEKQEILSEIVNYVSLQKFLNERYV